MSSPNKLRVGIIGLGHWGPHIVRNFSTDRRCSVRYVCDLLDSTFQRVENLIQADCAKTTRAEELIQSSEVDAVVVATKWEEYKELSTPKLRNKMKGKILVDARRFFSHTDFPDSQYLTIGRSFH